MARTVAEIDRDIAGWVLVRDGARARLAEPNFAREGLQKQIADADARIAELQKERAAVVREERIFENRETAWAAYRLRFPENARGFGPWANEHISFGERRKGSLLGLGFVDNPFSQTEAERLADRAKRQNAVRAAVRDLFNAGKRKEFIRGELPRMAAGKVDSIPPDILKHYA